MRFVSLVNVKFTFSHSLDLGGMNGSANKMVLLLLFLTACVVPVGLRQVGDANSFPSPYKLRFM